MKNVFKIRKKYENFVKNKKVILLDDIFTTGSTINAAAKVLKNAGASEIIAVIIASKK
jgi:predicted amidophosphoribosyltransferase